jgi:hypothetical protein
MADPTSQTNPLPPSPSEQGILKEDPKSLISLPWVQWFLSLAAKVNTINVNSVGWSGVTVDNGTPGTYGDATHYPIITTNINGLVTNVTLQAVTGGGGGNAIAINNQTGNYTLVLTDIPAASSYRGLVSINSSSASTITIPTNATVAFPLGSILYGLEKGTGATSFYGAAGVSLIGLSITGGGQYSQGTAIQIGTDVWVITGNLAYSNFASPTWNPTDKSAYITLSSGNLTAINNYGALWAGVRANISKASGKYYYEVLVVNPSSPYIMIGIANSTASLTTYLGSDTNSWVYYSLSGTKVSNGGFDTFGAAYTAGDVIGVAVDITGGNIWWSLNGVYQASGNPATGANPAYTGLTGTLFPAACCYDLNAGFTVRFLSSSFSYAAPSGFSPWA